MIALARSLARYYARSGVRVNTLMPGSIETAMSRASLTDPGYREEAQAALFLTSDEPSSVSGSIRWPGGGWMPALQSDTSSTV